MLLGFMLHFIPKFVEVKAQKILINMPIVAKVAFLLVVILFAVQFKSTEIQPFIYFQF
jgi:hypothetical protein